MQWRRLDHVPQIIPGHGSSCPQHPAEYGVTLGPQELSWWATNSIVTPMRTAQVKEGPLRDPHGQLMGMFTQLHHAQVQQQFTDIQPSLQHS